MSYTIAKSIAVKNGKVTITGRCNNVWPSTYERYETDIDTDELLRLLDDGMIQPVPSANGYKWTWILEEGLKGLTGRQRNETFARLAAEKTDKTMHVIVAKDGRYFAKTRTGYALTHNRDEATRLSKYQASYVSSLYKHYAHHTERA